MNFQVEMLAFGNWGEIRNVVVPDNAPCNTPTDMLSNVFHYGQNDVQPQQHPSVSVGDVVRFGNEKWLVCNVGFRQLTNDEYSEYTRMAQRDRHICNFIQEAHHE